MSICFHWWSFRGLWWLSVVFLTVFLLEPSPCACSGHLLSYLIVPAYPGHTKLSHLHIQRCACHEFLTYSLQACPPGLGYLALLPQSCVIILYGLTDKADSLASKVTLGIQSFQSSF